MNEFKLIKEKINELEYQETNGLLTDKGLMYLKELKQALQLQQTGVSGSVSKDEKCNYAMPDCKHCSLPSCIYLRTEGI